MFHTAGSVLDLYRGNPLFWLKTSPLDEEEGHSLKVLVVKNSAGKYDVWNIHPKRAGWQHVYSLDKCNPEKQLEESLASLKRLFDKEYVFKFSA